MAMKHAVILSLVFGALIACFIALLNQPYPSHSAPVGSAEAAIAEAVSKKQP